MTPADIKSARAALGLSARGFARLLGVEIRTVFRWESGGASIPGPVAVLVTAIMSSEDVRKHFGVEIKESCPLQDARRS